MSEYVTHGVVREGMTSRRGIIREMARVGEASEPGGTERGSWGPRERRHKGFRGGEAPRIL